jgi:hypothetical protein
VRDRVAGARDAAIVEDEADEAATRARGSLAAQRVGAEEAAALELDEAVEAGLER